MYIHLYSTKLIQIIKISTWFNLTTQRTYRDSDGGIIRPMPMVKRILSEPNVLPHIVQLLLTFDPVLVEQVAILLYRYSVKSIYCSLQICHQFKLLTCISFISVRSSISRVGDGPKGVDGWDRYISQPQVSLLLEYMINNVNSIMFRGLAILLNKSIILRTFSLAACFMYLFILRNSRLYWHDFSGYNDIKTYAVWPCSHLKSCFP